MKRFVLAAAAVLLLSACNPQTPVPPATPSAAPAAPAAVAVPAKEMQVVNWSPKETPAGVAFNVQKDGNSGISFELSEPAASEVTVTMGGKPLTGVVSSGVIVTATIPLDYLATPGKFPVVLQIIAQGRTMPAGDFEVVAN